MASGIPNLQFDVGALLRSDSFGSKLDSKGGLPVGEKLILGIADEDIRFTDCTHADEDDFEHVVIFFFFLGHFYIMCQKVTSKKILVDRIYV